MNYFKSRTAATNPYARILPESPRAAFYCANELMEWASKLPDTTNELLNPENLENHGHLKFSESPNELINALMDKRQSLTHKRTHI